MEPQPRQCRVPPVVFVLAVHLALWIGVIYGLVYRVPAYKRTYEDYGMRLPQITQLLLDVSDFTVDFGWLFIPGLLAAVVFDAVVLVLLWQMCQHRVWGWLWAVLMTLPQFLLLSLLILGLSFGALAIRQMFEKLGTP